MNLLAFGFFCACAAHVVARRMGLWRLGRYAVRKATRAGALPADAGVHADIDGGGGDHVHAPEGVDAGEDGRAGGTSGEGDSTPFDGLVQGVGAIGGDGAGKVAAAAALDPEAVVVMDSECAGGAGECGQEGVCSGAEAGGSECLREFERDLDGAAGAEVRALADDLEAAGSGFHEEL